MRGTPLSLSIIALCVAAAVLGSRVELSSAAGWEITHPGGGGAIMDVVLHPTLPGRMFVLSDMEGLYRSDDGGASFHWIGFSLGVSMTLALGIDPLSSANPAAAPVLLGTARGVWRSADGGLSWTLVGASRGLPVEQAFALVRWHPAQPGLVLVGPSWYNKHPDKFRVPQALNGTRRVYISQDHGQTFVGRVYTPEQGDLEVWDAAFGPTPATAQHVYVAASAGLFFSPDLGATWTEVEPPTQTAAPCYGVAVSPRTNFLFATFAVSAATSARTGYTGSFLHAADLLVSPTPPARSWQNVSAGLPIAFVNASFWRPTLCPWCDPSNSSEFVALGPGRRNGRFNLYGGKLSIRSDVEGGAATWPRLLIGEFSTIFAQPGSAPIDPAHPNNFSSADYGWLDISVMCHHYPFTPPAWKEQTMWASNGEGWFKTSVHNFTGGWTQQYCTLAGNETYTNRGTASTFNFDSASCMYTNARGMPSYHVLQGMADNGVLESFDGGASWNGFLQPDTNFLFDEGDAFLSLSVSTPDGGQANVLLAAAANGYGGGPHNDHNGQLLAKLCGSRARWMPVAGGPQRQRGLYGRMSALANSPHGNGQAVAVGAYSGVFYVPDVAPLMFASSVAAASDFTLIWAGATPAERVWVEFDPVVATRLWVLTQAALIRLDQQPGAATWAATQVAPAFAGVFHPHVWLSASQPNLTLIAWARTGAADARGCELAVSADGGRSFTAVFNASAALAMYTPSWYNASYPLGCSGVFGFASDRGDEVMIAFHDDHYQRGLGVFRGLLRWSNASAEETTAETTAAGPQLVGGAFVDWTGNRTFGGTSLRMPIIYRTRLDNGYIYASTQGAGLNRRDASDV